MFERRLYHHIDWALLIAVLALCALGVVTVYSATFDPTKGASHRWVIQLYAIALGACAMLVMLALDYRTFTDKSHLIYIAILGVLLGWRVWNAARPRVVVTRGATPNARVAR